MVTGTAKERSEQFVRYLEEKCDLPPEVPNNFRPTALKVQIEEALAELEGSFRSLDGNK
ncbi:MAG: hypothetical protein PHX61_06910 [Alphaproteobacteria bacterium]|nr:hypothetical protein [Alphaproteobacteria bacterium]